LFSQFFNIKDHYNISPTLSEVSLARYLGHGFSVRADGSGNKIKKIGDKRIDEISFYSVNGSLMYSFGHLIYDQPQGWFDPFVGVGVGSTWLKSEAAFTGNAE